MKIGDNKCGVVVLYKEVVGVANMSSREMVWSSTIKEDRMDMGKGNSLAVKVEASEGRGVSFLGDKGALMIK